jgi:NADH:ubiquinone oxidoreductase subunit 3 (subunit A)
MWLLGESRKKTPRVVYNIFLLLILIPGLICMFMYSNDPDFRSVIDPHLVKISIFLYCLYLLLYYLLIVCREMEVSLEKSIKAGVDNLITTYKSDK